MPQEALRRGLIDGFSKLVSGFIEASRKLILYFLHRKAAKICENLQRLFKKNWFDFEDLKKNIHLVTIRYRYPFKSIQISRAKTMFPNRHKFRTAGEKSVYMKNHCVQHPDSPN